MKTTLALVIALSVFSCSKKDDPIPTQTATQNNTTQPNTSSKKVYLKFTALKGNKVDKYFQVSFKEVDSLGKEYFNYDTPITKVLSNAPEKDYYFEIPKYTTKPDTKHFGRYIFKRGTEEGKLTTEVDAKFDLHLAEKDTMYLMGRTLGYAL